MLIAYQENSDRSVSISDNHWLDAYRVPFGEWIDQTVDWVNTEIEWVTDTIKWPFQTLFNFIMNENPSRDSIMSVSWVWIVIAMFLVGSFARNTRVGLMVASMVAVSGFLGQDYWLEISKTFGMISIAVFLCVIVGIPLGVIAGRFDAAWNVMRPALDAMQVVHSFVWMLPFIFFFGIGNVSATMVTMLYALPPLVRLTNLGIRQVPEDVIEASRSFGANELRVLTDVQLPLARPAIMTGFNQTLLLAFSMLGIAAYMGADGLGRLIFRAINNINIALGAGAGLTFFLCAVILDRISQPEEDDGLSLVGRVRQAFAYRRDTEATYAAALERSADAAAERQAVEPDEPDETPEPLRSGERTGLMLVIAGSLVAILSTVLVWANDAGPISSWGRAADENLPGASFSGLDATGGSYFGILLLIVAVVALLAALRPMLHFPQSVSNGLNRIQGVLLFGLTAGLVLMLVLNLAGVDFDVIETITMVMFAVLVVLIGIDTFVRDTPRLGADGAVICSVAALGLAVSYLLAQASPFTESYSDGIGVFVAIAGTAIAVVGGCLALFGAPYASRRPAVSGISFTTLAAVAFGLIFIIIGASAAWVVDERAGTGNRVFYKGLTSNGPLLGMPSIIFGGIAALLVLVLALGIFSGPRRWHVGSLATGFGLAAMLIPLAFTLSITRNGDTDYFNDRNALTGAGILLVMIGGAIFFAVGRSTIHHFRRRRIYADARMQIATSIDLDDEETSVAAELVGASS